MLRTDGGLRWLLGQGQPVRGPDGQVVALTGINLDITESRLKEALLREKDERLRIAELDALFAAADEEDYEDADDTGVLPTDQVKSLKAELKQARAEEHDREVGGAKRWLQVEMYLLTSDVNVQPQVDNFKVYWQK